MGNLTCKLINFGFPRCETISKLDFRGKRQGFDSKKPNRNALWGNISRDIKQTLLRSESRAENCSCISIFARILKLIAQIASMFTVKYFCSQYFSLARRINKSKNKSKNSKISRTNSEATSGHSDASLNHSWALRILNFALRRSNYCFWIKSWKKS